MGAHCPGESKMYRCVPQSHSVLVQYWTNDHCQGAADRWKIAYNCEELHPNVFYRMQCSHIVEPDLRNLVTEDENNGINNVDISIVIVLLSVACIIGIFVGYLLHKRKKKSGNVNDETILPNRKSSDIEFPVLRH